VMQRGACKISLVYKEAGSTRDGIIDAQHNCTDRAMQ
jgi:hypothetical protein